MSFLKHGTTEEYYQKFIELQEKLRKSEEERLKLEMKFNEMVQVSREEEQIYYRKLRGQYKRFLEEDRRRQERNEKVLRVIERVESRAAMLAAKTQRFELLRKQYHTYLKRVFANGKQEEELRMPTIAEAKRAEEKKNKARKSPKKVDVVKQYLSSLSTPACREEVLKTARSNELLSYSDESPDDEDCVLPEDKSSKLADQIIRSIKSGRPKTEESRRWRSKPLRSQNFCATKLSPPESKPEDLFDSGGFSDGLKFGERRKPLESVYDSEKIVQEDYQNEKGFGLPRRPSEENHEELEEARASTPETTGHLQEVLRPNEEVESSKVESPQEVHRLEEDPTREQIHLDEREKHEVEEKPEEVKLQNDQIEEITKEEEVEEEEKDLSKTKLEEPEVPDRDRVETPVDDEDEKREEIQKTVLQEEAIAQRDYDQPLQHISNEDDHGETNQHGQDVQYDESGLPVGYEEQGQPMAYDEQYAQPDQYDEQHVQYDELGQPIQYDDPVNYDGDGRSGHYDQHGRPVQYDEQGQPIQYDENGRPVQYDDQGQLIQYDETSRPIQYDEQGQPIQYDESTRPIQYDEKGQPIQQQYYDEQYQYDPNAEYYQQYDDQQDPNVQQSEERIDEDLPPQSNEIEEEMKTDGQKEEGGEAETAEQKTNVTETAEQKTNNVMDMLDTDTESAKQEVTKVSNESDFDFSNG